MTSSVHSESILELFNKLCDLHLGEEKRCHLVQPKVERRICFQHLHHKVFDTLINFLKSPQSKENNSEKKGASVEIAAILQFIFNLRTARNYGDADRLEHLLETLMAEPTDDKKAVLRFLIKLSDTGSLEPPPLLGHDLYRVEVANLEKSRKVCLPEGPVWFGDTKPTAGSLQWTVYDHFPRHLFEVGHLKCKLDQPTESTAVKVFEMTPGTALVSGNLFNTENMEFRDGYEQLTRFSLFGGLVSARGSSLDARLELPDLPDSSLPEITIPKVRSLSELSEDEGFITTEASSSAASPVDGWIEEDIWEEALHTVPNQHYVWERIGCEPVITERHYLTEAGPKAVDELTRFQKLNEYLLDPSCISPLPREISASQLVKDVIYLLIGVPSLSFPYSQETGSFTICPGIFTTGISPDAFHSFVGDFVDCGTMHQNLVVFSAPQKMDSLYTNGLVLQAFAGGVRAVLQHYRAAVLAIPRDTTLLGLRMHCHRVMQQIKFLSDLCHCADKGYNLAEASFPVGVPLITYLYEQTLAALNTDNYLLMLSLLRTTCQPFTLFIQDWVFHGTFRDIYSEFMIQMNMDYLEARDETYWERGYTLLVDESTPAMPPFLSDLALNIFHSGKALNLLRMCNPKHFLCRVSDSDIPQVSISYLRDDLDTVEKQCRMYASRMREVAQQVSLTRAEQQRRAHIAKKELLETARHMAANEISRLQGVLRERRKVDDAKKRVEFQRLKEQMNADLQRRADELAQEKANDKEYMARVMRDEDAFTEEEIKLEQEARDELIKYYAELGEEATRRERHALWKIQRARLDLARQKLLEEDQKQWQLEMEEYKQAQRLLAKDTTPLPHWAKGSASSMDTMTNQWGVQEQVQERDWSLPSWAECDSPPAVLLSPDVGDVDVVTYSSERRDDLARGGELLSTQEQEGIVVKATDSADGHINEHYQLEVMSKPRVEDASSHLSSRRLKTHVHMVPGMSINQETEQRESHPQIHCSDYIQATSETSASEEGRTIVKFVEGHSASKESEGEKSVLMHIKMSGTLSATTETEEKVLRSQIQQVPGCHANMQNQEEFQAIPKLRHHSAMNIATETESAEWKLKRPSLFGHVTQLSKSDCTFHAPRLKRQLDKHANIETDFRDFAIKPHIRMHKTRCATAESSEQVERPQIHISKESHVSKESEYVDFDALRRKRFQSLNVHGHSSDSTVEKLMYGDRSPPTSTNNRGIFTPLVDLLAGVPGIIQGITWDGDKTRKIGNEDIEIVSFTPLSVLLKQALSTPLSVQVSLVNDMVVNYFLVDQKIEKHFEALHNYLFMADGEFAQNLTDILLEKLMTPWIAWSSDIRQEMQHFVRVMQGYMANQIILVTWQELQQALDVDVHSLDDLLRVHSEYLHKALFRCLLNNKAAPIMKIIQDIFCLILKFCSQLTTSSWEHSPATKEVIHPNYSAMVTSYNAFKEYFAFLFKVVNKLAARGYQPHLQELLLRLNFNDYYSA
ncbi:hypothetical protein C0Q70_15840 [Pomacea canaliculata]|uniref:Gamma-tubulin complex component 6 n=1 Tax=Pomacea canaliculata TaxID=400727 RepID=A0A2T7NVY9_POMCA|nr:hypothetical protein C0Q70_15840 [Pomacea canaliculata]